MKKYLNKNERENLGTLLCSNEIEDALFGLNLLQQYPRYKYFKNKIIYRNKYNKHSKIRVKQLVNTCYYCMSRPISYVPYAAEIIGKYIKTHEKIF